MVEKSLYMQNRRKSPQNCRKSLQNRRKPLQNCRKLLQNSFLVVVRQLLYYNYQNQRIFIDNCKNILTCSTLYGKEFLLYPLVSCWVAKKVKGNSLKLQFSIADFGRNMIPMDSIFFALYSAQKMEKTM